MSDTVLVTGANGLIGYAVALALSQAGRSVVGLVRRAPADALPFASVVGDVTDAHRLHELFRTHGFGAVVHSGAISGPMVGLDAPFTTIATNIVGTANVLEVCRIHEVQRVVFTSSATAYGDTLEGPVSEDVALRPRDMYGATKAAAEALVDAYSLKHGLDGVSLRISWVYGPRRSTPCLIRTFITDALAGRPTQVDFGVGFNRQYVHVEDVVASILASLDAELLPQRVYNVTGGSCVTLDEVAGIVRRVLPQAQIDMKPGPDPVDVRQEEFDISAIKRDLGWGPRIGLEEGIASYTEWLRRH
jgi:UDP-glucuronate 4-epimerase